MLDCPSNCDICSVSGCSACVTNYRLYTTDGLCYATGSCLSLTYESATICIGMKKIKYWLYLYRYPTKHYSVPG